MELSNLYNITKPNLINESDIDELIKNGNLILQENPIHKKIEIIFHQNNFGRFKHPEIKDETINYDDVPVIELRTKFNDSHSYCIGFFVPMKKVFIKKATFLQALIGDYDMEFSGYHEINRDGFLEKFNKILYSFIERNK